MLQKLSTAGGKQFVDVAYLNDFDKPYRLTDNIMPLSIIVMT